MTDLNSNPDSSIKNQQLKLIRVFAAVFVLNASIILLVPWILIDSANLSIGIDAQTGFRQLLMIATGFIILRAANLIQNHFLNHAQQQTEEVEKDKFKFKAYLFSFCLYEVLIILAMISLLTWADLISYLILGLTGFNKLIKDFNKISRN